MCIACDDPRRDEYSLDHPVVLLAREIERATRGEAVPNDAWAVYLGLADGSILWQQFERIRAALDEAKSRGVASPLKAKSLSARRRLDCEPVA
jgi:hypothetical protein